MTFQYKQYPIHGEPGSAYDVLGPHVLRPIIPIGLAWRNQSLDSFAQIDSGADLNLFDGELGEALDLDVRAGEAVPFSGAQAGWPAVAYLHEIVLIVGNRRVRTPVFFSYDLSDSGHGLLGQRGFFDLFTVKFDYRKEQIEVKEKR